MIDFDLTLENDDVLLCPLRKKDLDDFRKIVGDPLLWIYFTRDLSVKEELEQWVEESISQIKTKSRLAFTITDKRQKRIAGSTSFLNISGRDRRVEIGATWLGREFHGKGINRAAKHLLMDYCFETCDFMRVESKTDVLNLWARNALQKVGMTEEGILRSHTLMTHNRRRDTLFYSMLKWEWAEQKEKQIKGK